MRKINNCWRYQEPVGLAPVPTGSWLVNRLSLDDRVSTIMKTIYKEVLPLAVAFLMTGTIANAMEPVKPTVTVQKTEQHQEPQPAKVAEAPKEEVAPPAPAKVVTWQDNPQHCTSEQFIAAQEPFNCTDKQIPTSTHQSVQAAPTQAVAPSGTCSEWMAAAGITDIANATRLLNWESHCNPNAVNPQSGACGLQQELPCGKSGCGLGNGACQMKWFAKYVNDRYGSMEAAVAFHLVHNWY